MNKPYCYEYPRPAVTVDAAVFRREPTGGRWQVLLIQRGRPPYEGRWALPGGFVDMDETLQAAAERELAEETGLGGVELQQLHTFGDPGRDPRGRTVSVVYVGLLEDASSPASPSEAPEHRVAAGDDAAAAWHALDSLPPVAFDHDRILARAAAWLREHRPTG